MHPSQLGATDPLLAAALPPLPGSNAVATTPMPPDGGTVGALASSSLSSSKKRERERAAAAAAAKKREKAMASWKSRVVAAVQSNEVTRLETVLSESPLRKEDGNKYNKMHEFADSTGTPVLTVQQHMDYLVPNCVPKNRHSLVKGREARNVLLQYIADMAPLSLITPLRNGRSLLHTACLYGDVEVTRTILAALEDKTVATMTLNNDAADSDNNGGCGCCCADGGADGW